MKNAIGQTVREFMDGYIRDNRLPELWRAPRLRFGDARHPRFPELKRAVREDHLMPGEVLDGATTIISYFVPFREEIAGSNRDGRPASDLWALAYRATNDMAAKLNDRLVEAATELGYRAAVPENIGWTPETLTSRWSQRHVAWICGQGTFGVNNMLITDEGCCGRYFSIVSDLPVEHDDIVPDERCAYRRNRTCLACVKRCFAGALTADGFDRRACHAACGENAKRLDGVTICGKCVVSVPCSFAGF